LALGSNLCDRRAYLNAAVSTMPDLVRPSPIYETDPVGGPDAQGPYLNMVVQLESGLTSRQLLALCRSQEAAAGRVRLVHWGPRTLDCDLVWIDGTRVNEPDLVVPHPRFQERDFVLAPLSHLAPELMPDGWTLAGASGVYWFGEADWHR
jgi:2-amino-4-hydroxy-6-hydroxymethyldihydropteridine diphosphokinase